jgi:molybdenum cofactor cytidylyltransferase
MTRFFALIPAAGRSRRMGRHKLLLPVRGGTVIDSLLNTLTAKMDGVLALVRADDTDLQTVIGRHGNVTIVVSQADPPDMRDSVELLLAELSEMQPTDAWVLTPADHPLISPAVLEMLMDGFHNNPEAIHLPTFQGRSGHPAIFPCRLAQRVSQLPPGQGLNALRSLPDVQTVLYPTDEPSVLWDLDTPEDYEHLLQALSDRPA